MAVYRQKVVVAKGKVFCLRCPLHLDEQLNLGIDRPLPASASVLKFLVVDRPLAKRDGKIVEVVGPV